MSAQAYALRQGKKTPLQAPIAGAIRKGLRLARGCIMPKQKQAHIMRPNQ